jgi:hypothetical protein
MLKKLCFEKDTNNNWYIVLSEWVGSHNELQMVAGADTMLDYLSEKKNRIELEISTSYFIGADKLVFVREALELENGAIYYLDSFQNNKIDIEIWLCDVTKFVLEYFPITIYFKKVDL